MEKNCVINRLRKGNRTKIWTNHEVKQILNYLQKFPKMEAPTAQIYYRKLVAKSGIDATWEQARRKVEQMKCSYKKSKDSITRAAASRRHDGLQICPNYKQLNEIFGEKPIYADVTMMDSTDDSTISDTQMETNDQMWDLSDSDDSFHPVYVSNCPFPSHALTGTFQGQSHNLPQNRTELKARIETIITNLKSQKEILEKEVNIKKMEFEEVRAKRALALKVLKLQKNNH